MVAATTIRSNIEKATMVRRSNRSRPVGLIRIPAVTCPKIERLQQLKSFSQKDETRSLLNNLTVNSEETGVFRIMGGRIHISIPLSNGSHGGFHELVAQMLEERTKRDGRNDSWVEAKSHCQSIHPVDHQLRH